MGYNIFVSYKYADDDVKPFSFWNRTTVRDYVTRFEEGIEKYSNSFYKGEHDDEDLSYLSEATIEKKLHDKIYGSSVTVVFISPNMRNPLEEDCKQWIPREISYSLKNVTRNGMTSHVNSLVFVILPDRFGSYLYYRTMNQFNIIQRNIDNGYAEVVKWDDFQGGYYYYIAQANANRDSRRIQPYKVI